jgi:transcription antitermination factor NusG
VSELSWYALRVTPKREDMVKKLLINKGFKAYTKTERRFGKWINDKKSDNDYIAAPGYVFCGTETNPWTFVHTYHMVKTVVSLNAKPVKLHPVGLADFLGFDDFNLPEHFRYMREAPFDIGDLVCIDAPAFEGFELRVKDIQRHEVIFDLVMMGRNVEARFPVSQCYKAA